MEEESKARYGIDFFYAETNFFTNRLKRIFPKIDEAGIKNSTAFLERQKEANCPFFIHTRKRKYDWIVFSRIPDKTPASTDGSYVETHSSIDFESDEVPEVADTTSGSHQIDDMEEDTTNDQNCNPCTDESGASSEKYSSADLTAGYHSIFNT